MYEQVETGPLYDKAVQLMSTYRSVAARMENAKARTKGKLDRRLERLGEKIGEALGELSDNEMMALDCWQHGFMPDVYEVDHAAITRKPYVSIRKVERWDEEYDIEDHRAAKRADDKVSVDQKKHISKRMLKLLRLSDDDL
jgi:hypothetical protein